MEPTTAGNKAGADGNHQDGAPAVPAAGPRWRLGMLVLTAGAGLALAFAAVTVTPAAPATAAATARTAATVDAQPEFEPCPCINPMCRPGCSQSMASGGPAAMIYRHTHPAAECTDPKCISGTPPNKAASAAPTHAGTSTAVNCPPHISDPGSGGC
jgi:hypothetical protein